MSPRGNLHAICIICFHGNSTLHFSHNFVFYARLLQFLPRQCVNCLLRVLQIPIGIPLIIPARWTSTLVSSEMRIIPAMSRHEVPFSSRFDGEWERLMSDGWTQSQFFCSDWQFLAFHASTETHDDERQQNRAHIQLASGEFELSEIYLVNRSHLNVNENQYQFPSER